MGNISYKFCAQFSQGAVLFLLWFRYEEVRGHPQKFARIIGEHQLSDILGFCTTLRACGQVFAVLTSGMLPASSYVVRLQQTDKPLVGSIVSWAKYGGLWKPSGGSLSPWGTVLSGESFEPDGTDHKLVNASRRYPLLKNQFRFPYAFSTFSDK